MTNGVKEQIIPRHVGIIMDGNGRWAKQKGKLQARMYKEKLPYWIHAL